MTLPAFRYHPDPLASGSIVESKETCRCCEQNRGYIYAGPVYSEEDDLDDVLCPWCIADGSAHDKFDATFVDIEAFPDETPKSAIEEIMNRTPGYSAWQSEKWPACCGDATAFLMPVGAKEIREGNYELEGPIMSHIVYEMKISGGLANTLLKGLSRDNGPTAYVFRCLKCLRHHFHIDQM
jgi:uncharacterized protein CbrC (UPF0167 family)